MCKFIITPNIYFLFTVIIGFCLYFLKFHMCGLNFVADKNEGRHECISLLFFKSNFTFQMKQHVEIIWPQQDYQAVFLVCLVSLLFLFGYLRFLFVLRICCLLDTFVLQVINVNSPVSAVYTNLQLILPSCQTKDTSCFKSTVCFHDTKDHSCHSVRFIHVRLINIYLGAS